MRDRHSLRRILTLAWLVPGGVALSLSIAAFFMLGWFDFQNAVRRKISDLDGKSLIVARRLAAEVLLGERGASESVSGVLKGEMGVTAVQILKDSSPCTQDELRTKGFCSVRQASVLSVIRPLPLVQNPTFVQVSVSAPTFGDSLNLTLLIWSVVPIVFIIGIGMLGLRRLLARFVLQPVEALTDNASRGQETPANWPVELAQLSGELREAFLRRDMAMVGQMASGVIHDIRTLLHSSWTAAQLAEEQPVGTEKRLQRLESFLRAAQTNFPKMQALIQTTLDGSREIRVKPVVADLSATPDQALRATCDLASRSKVAIEVEAKDDVRSVLHDPTQVERVLSNIVKNAIEAANQSSSKSPRILIKAICEGAGARVIVEDNGPGLGTDPLHILRSVRSTKTHGSGLGLVISRKIVEAHSGSLTAGASDQLGGARFDVLLPGPEGMA